MIRILVETSPGETRIAVLNGNLLQDYALWRPGAPDGVGDVYRARMAAHIPAMAGAFVTLPPGFQSQSADGFLPDTDGATTIPEGSLVGIRIVRAGQGGKGPRLARTEIDPGPPGLVRRGPTPSKSSPPPTPTPRSSSALSNPHWLRKSPP